MKGYRSSPPPLHWSDQKHRMHHHHQQQLHHSHHLQKQQHPHHHPPGESWLPWYYCFIVGLIGLLVFVNSIDADFAYDDSRAIKNNLDLRPESSIGQIFLHDFWGTPLNHSGSHKSYRPLCVLSFRLNYFIHQLSPRGYHLVNVILHSAVCILFARITGAIFRGQVRPSLVASIIFAVHPIHTDAVASVVGRADVGCGLFFLLSLHQYMTFCNRPHEDTRRPLSLSLFFAACSMLTKETGITVLAVCAAYHLLIHHRLLPLTKQAARTVMQERKFASLREGVLHLLLAGVLLMVLRLALMGWKAPDFAASDNPASAHPSFITRSLTFFFLPVFNFGLMLYPRWLSFDWSMESIPLLHSWCDRRNFFSLIFYVFFATFVRHSLQSLLSRPGCSHSHKRSTTTIRSSCHHHTASCYSSSCSSEYARNGLSSSKRSKVRTLLTPPRTTVTTAVCTLTSTTTSTSSSSLSPSSSSCSNCKDSFFSSFFSVTGNMDNNNGCSCNLNNNNNFPGSSFASCNIVDEMWQSGTGPASEMQHQGGAAVASSPLLVTSSLESPSGSKSPSSSSLDKAAGSEDALFMSILLMVFPWLPASNLFFYVGFVVAERVLYVPSMGLCLFIATGMEGLMKRKTSPFITAASLIALSILLMSFSVRTFVRNSDWKSEEALYAAGIAINPAKAYGNLGNIVSAHGKKVQAEYFYRQALQHRSNMADVHYNLGVLLQEQGNRTAEALQSYENAIRYRPRLALAHLNKAILLAQSGRTEEAISTYRHCAKLDGTGLKDPYAHEAAKTSALFNLGKLYSDLGQYEEAVATYKEAIDRMPRYYPSHSLYNMLGEAFFKMGRFSESEKWYKEALRVKADHVPAHLTLARLYSRLNRTDEAEQLFVAVATLSPNDSSVYQHHGQFLMDQSRYGEAANLFVRAVQNFPNDFELVFNAASALRQANRKHEAELYYKRAARLRPNEVTSHATLGAILHLNGKLLEAEIEYLHALRLRPDDAITQSNLAKLRQLMQKRAI